MNPIFEDSFAIATYHTDPFGYLKISSLFALLQDAASRDAARKGFGYYSLIERNVFWVLVRVNIQVVRMPSWEEKVVFRTWPKDIAGILAFRDFEIASESGDALVSGTTSWTQVDLKTRRLVRIELPDNYYSLPDKHAIISRAKKISLPEKMMWHDDILVRTSHIDVNWHVNNTQYLEWVINELSIKWLKQKTMAEISVNFLAEGRLDDIINVGLKHSRDLEWYACVRRKSDMRDLCVIKLNFAEKKK
ncbi:MAG: hypothetical protein J7L96_08265 [Bacteroidales bacterium]|nr:hypothetical protein [Bacteroidales bacterium]